MKYREAEIQDIPEIASLAAKLWNGEAETLSGDIEASIRSDEAKILIAVEDRIIGFAQFGLRHDYVEGTHSNPVGYLEGIYVEPEYRMQEIARCLLQACEARAEAMGCTEFASDCELDNRTSLAFHLSCGFIEANRIICFTKRLNRNEQEERL